MQKEFERLQDELERIYGVREVEVLAYPDQEVGVALDFEKMSRMNISLGRMASAVQSANANIPAGDINIGNRKFNIHTSGSYESVEEIKNTIISADDGKIVYLKDVAQVGFGYEDMNYLARYNGQRAVFLTVNQKTGTNIFKIMNPGSQHFYFMLLSKLVCLIHTIQ